MHRLIAIAQKEFYHIFRDPRSLFIVLAMPVLMTFMYGYAINLDIEHVRLVVVDEDQSTASRELRDKLYGSGRFRQPDLLVDVTNPHAILRAARTDGVLQIPQGFSRGMEQREDFRLQLLVDGADGNLAAAVNAYTGTVLNAYLMEKLLPNQELPGIQLSQQVLYNPDLKSSHFFVPGLLSVILMLISGLLTSITIAREREVGTLEQLLTTPVRPHEILFGKLIPYFVIALVDTALVIGLARFVFDVPFRGSALLLIGSSVVYISAALSIGILISTVAKTQLVAMLLASTATLMPSVMLSGFVFAIKNMPVPLQYLSNIIPAKHFVIILRGVMLKGSPASLLVLQVLFLFIIMAVLLTIALRRFNTKVA